MAKDDDILEEARELFRSCEEREADNRDEALEQEDRRNRKTGADVEIGRERLVLRAPNGSRWAITVSNAGVLGAIAL